MSRPAWTASLPYFFRTSALCFAQSTLSPTNFLLLFQASPTLPCAADAKLETPWPTFFATLLMLLPIFLAPPHAELTVELTALLPASYRPCAFLLMALPMSCTYDFAPFHAP